MAQPPEGWEYDPEWLEKWRAEAERMRKRHDRAMYWFGVGTHTVCYAIGWGMGAWFGLTWGRS